MKRLRVLYVLVLLLGCQADAAHVNAGTPGMFTDGHRNLYVGMHFASPGQELDGNCVYLHCTFDFNGPEPLLNATRTGVVFLDCDFNTNVSGTAYLSGSYGQMALVDCRFTGKSDQVEWYSNPHESMRCYQAGVTFDGEELTVSEDGELTVDMEGTHLLDAYRFVFDGDTVYNVYNLLGGADGWDPLEQRETILKAEQSSGLKLTDLPISLDIQPMYAAVLDGEQQQFTLKGMTLDERQVGIGFYGFAVSDTALNIDNVSEDGCTVSATYADEQPCKATLLAVSELGLESASALTMAAARLDPPVLLVMPSVHRSKRTFSLSYMADFHGMDDLSMVVWYRQDNRHGKNREIVKMSCEPGNDKLSYTATQADAGKWLVAEVSAAHIRSGYADAVMSDAVKVPARFKRKGK